MGIAQWGKFATPVCTAVLIVAFNTSIVAQGITQFIVPGAASTFPVAINNSGDVTGYFCPTVDCSQVRGFVREFKGAIAVFEGIPSGINDAGTVAGRLGRLQGFLRDKKGSITVVDVPELFGPRETLTGPLAIDNSGDTAGWIACSPACSEWFYGFVRDKHGLITTFFVPPQGLHPNSINARGEITGWNKIDIFELRGFVRAARSGDVTIFEAPGARGPLCAGAFTNPTTINNGGDVAGSYNDCQIGPRHRGFVRGRDGSIATFDAAPDSSTEVSSINERGDVTGDFFNANGRHNFVREVTGNMTVFDIPKGPASSTSINNRGDVTGYFTVTRNGASFTYGFLRMAH